MECVSEEKVHRCRVCHETVIQSWELVCERCAERNKQFEEKMWLAETEQGEEMLKEKAEGKHLQSRHNSFRHGGVKRFRGDVRGPD